MAQLFTPAARTADAPLSPIWRYIQLDQFTCPSGSATEAVRKGLFGLLQRFGMGSQPKVFSVAQDELQSLPDDLCRQVAPDPDWHEAAAVLDARISHARSATPSSGQVQIIVGGPSSGTAEVVRCWAKTHSITVIEPPPPEDILTGGREWFERVITRPQTSPVVIPHLERYYLRHQHGLGLIRRLLPWLLEQPCSCLIGCSSWAWAYFDKALHATQLFPAAWALEALTHQQLQHWFTNLTVRQGKSQFLFRQTNIYNDTDGERDLQCVADFYLDPRHDASVVRQVLSDVALTSPFIQLERPVSVIVAETPWGTHYRLKAYPIDGQDQFLFTSDLTVRGKATLTALDIHAARAIPLCVRNDQ